MYDYGTKKTTLLDVCLC